MTQRISEALGMAQIYDLIEAGSEFLAEVKRRKLKEAPFNLGSASSKYQWLGNVMQVLEGKDRLRTELKELFTQLPRLSLPDKRPQSPLALHELFLLKEFLYHYGNLQRKLASLDCLELSLPGAEYLFALLDPEGSGLPAFRIGPANSPKLGEILAAKQQLILHLKHARQKLLEEAREVLELPQLKEDFILSRSQSELADRLLHSSYFVLSSESVANLSFALADNDLCLHLKKRMSELNVKQEKEEARILKALSTQIYKDLPYLRLLVHMTSEYAWYFMLADFAFNHHCCLPRLHRKRQIMVKAARNLPLQQHLESAGRRYQPVDLCFDDSISVITGPNMGGKTTVLKTVGQLCWLAAKAIPLPCAEAVLPIFQQIWINQDDAEGSADLSSFGREVVSFSAALEDEGCTLFLLDEFAKGTNPAEGEALASAVLSYLAQTKHLCIAATHYTGPALLKGVAQYAIAGLDPESPLLKAATPISPQQRLAALGEAMDHRVQRLKQNQPPPLGAIAIARILGLPQSILDLIKDQ